MFISRHIFNSVSPRKQCAETRSLEVFQLLFQSLPHLFDLFVISEIFATKMETLYSTNRSHTKQKTFLYEYLLHWLLLPTKKTRSLFFGSILLKHCRYFDYWNQPLNYLDCHETGLCCYIVIHIENLLHSLQLFYFHFWPIYWLSLISTTFQNYFRFFRSLNNASNKQSNKHTCTTLLLMK
jgi:hypothetical protein